MEGLSVAVAKCVPVVLSQRRRDRRITEARVASEVGGCPVRDVTPRGLNAIVVPLLRSLRVSRRWSRGRIKSGRLWMRTSRNRKSKE